MLHLVQVLPRTRRSWLVAAVAMALVALGIGMVQRHRYDHRDEYVQFAVPWQYFELSDDGRTITLHGAHGSSSCGEPVGVEIKQGDPVAATAIYRRQTLRDGRDSMFCTLDLTLLRPVQARLHEPLPDGALVVDGYERSDNPGGPAPCPLAQQRVGDPVRVPRSPFDCG